MEGGPLSVKCHSKRLDSRGLADIVGSGDWLNSRDSRRMRLIVGDLVLNFGTEGSLEGDVSDMVGR